MKYQPVNLDYEISPYTGLTRESWIEIGKYLLEGIFRHIPSYDFPIVLPRSENEITYPHKSSVGNQLLIEEMAQKFEGLARSLFIAAPLIHNNPDLEICGYSMKKYYSQQILFACTKGNKNFVGYFEDLQELIGSKNPNRIFQQTVETCALVICLDICKKEIWENYTKAEKDTVAKFLLSYAHTATVPQNWRMFNMLVMAFLHREGYSIDRDIMLDHAQAILGYYAGSGWYRDGQSFDYYSCWAFNVYTPIWNNWYGYENLPYIARQFEKNSNKLMETYPDFFDKDGFTMMWGRSCLYRNAATSPLSENMLLKNSVADAGLARRIASGALLQFITRDDFLIDGIPTMGFYRQFSPLIQGYSCTESAYWFGKAFLCINLPENHPFWTAKENNGSWDKMKEKEVKETVLDGPALCFTNHSANGETVLRTGKVIKKHNDKHGMWNYSKLAYNSKYPWEAAPTDKIEAMQYVISNTGEEPKRGNATLWHGIKDSVLYRRQFFDYSLDCETHWMPTINLADFPIEYGIVRADKLQLKAPATITLGSYGFPDNGTEIIHKSSGKATAIILKGYDHMNREKQLAMTVYDGWEDIDVISSKNTNPDSENSLIIYAKTKRFKKYGYDRYMLISQVITKESHRDFSDEELFPIKEILYTDEEKCGGYGPVVLKMQNGKEKIIDFDMIEGNLQL